MGTRGAGTRVAGALGACTQGVRGRRVVRLGSHEGDLRQWVIAIKHNQWEAMGEHLGALLGQQVRRVCPGIATANAVVVAVPMPWIRRSDRGIDHSFTLAQGVARALSLRCVQPLRQRAGGTQVNRAGRAGRLHAVARFIPRRGFLGMRARLAVKGRVVVLVDDVRTTGATLALAGAALRSLGAAAVIEAVATVREAEQRETRSARSRLVQVE